MKIGGDLWTLNGGASSLSVKRSEQNKNQHKKNWVVQQNKNKQNKNWWGPLDIEWWGLQFKCKKVRAEQKSA